MGEIRDKETATIAIEAALTGHLVLSTLHTNSAPETVTRLMDMGIEPFNVASALNLVLAQRLVRRVCNKCAEAYKMDAAEIAAAKIDGGVTLRDMHFTDMALSDAKARATEAAKPFMEQITLDSKMEDIPVFRGKGCEQCDGSGLRGRQGLYEVLNMTPRLRKLIMQSAGAAEIQKAAIEEGMLTLRMDGWLKVLKGITPLDQVVRETAADAHPTHH